MWYSGLSQVRNASALTFMNQWFTDTCNPTDAIVYIKWDSYYLLGWDNLITKLIKDISNNKAIPKPQTDSQVLDCFSVLESQTAVFDLFRYQFFYIWKLYSKGRIRLLPTLGLSLDLPPHKEIILPTNNYFHSLIFDIYMPCWK